MILFGLIIIRDRERALAEGIERPCPACGRTQPHGLLETYRQAHLFFIPLWRWNWRRFLACDVCGQVESITAEEAGEICRRSE